MIFLLNIIRIYRWIDIPVTLLTIHKSLIGHSLPKYNKIYCQSKYMYILYATHKSRLCSIQHLSILTIFLKGTIRTI